MSPLKQTKVVIRHLPPGMTEEVFSHLIESFSDAIEWKYFVPGRATAKRTTVARAYITFKNPADIAPFASQFDHHQFFDQAGKEMRALVEYAPNQQVPRKKKSAVDSKLDTIGTDPHYLSFEAAILKPAEPLHPSEVIEKLVAQVEAASAEKPTITPLIEFVRSQRRARSAKKGKGKGSTAIVESKAEIQDRKAKLREKRMQKKARKAASLGPLPPAPAQGESAAQVRILAKTDVAAPADGTASNTHVATAATAGPAGEPRASRRKARKEKFKKQPANASGADASSAPSAAPASGDTTPTFGRFSLAATAVAAPVFVPGAASMPIMQQPMAQTQPKAKPASEARSKREPLRLYTPKHRAQPSNPTTGQ
eukprot:TRINITY_DN237_c1_g1_i4.p2 TRINITY_DN237_c1_g1~~TRINITY_DN237_c1_g1_i4.p2  ORF type:complete len:368 (+),score=88.65 TRINITY_DN237_c1_g1_i4:283-1386(+)